MTTPESATRHTVQAYHQARFRGDIATAAQRLADRFAFHRPFIESDSPTGHLAGIEQLVQITRMCGLDEVLPLPGMRFGSAADRLATGLLDIHRRARKPAPSRGMP